jgi:hypothetical protein
MFIDVIVDSFQLGTLADLVSTMKVNSESLHYASSKAIHNAMLPEFAVPTRNICIAALLNYVPVRECTNDKD